ncbi:uncharacterized protein BDW70DRAFT_145243 [Aspergillus foveolatus]|uniref:uncharacterized protein n=1 Tax=Aspergillus foveolatus TaxID=210207 RepID=UPI003CCD73D2
MQEEGTTSSIAFLVCSLCLTCSCHLQLLFLRVFEVVPCIKVSLTGCRNASSRISRG